MKQRRFGRTGWQVGEIGYGMWGMAGWTGSEDTESLAALQLRGGSRLQLLRYRLGLRRRTQRAAARPTDPRESDAHAVRRDQDPAEEPPVAVAARHSARRGVSAGLHPRVRRAEPGEPRPPHIDLLQFHVWEDDWADDDRWQRAMDDLKREGLVHAVGVSINRWEPWNGLRTLRTGLDRRGAGDLQHLRSGAGGRALPALPRARHRRDRARSVRRRVAHRHADEGLDAGPRATGAARTSCRRI